MIIFRSLSSLRALIRAIYLKPLLQCEEGTGRETRVILTSMLRGRQTQTRLENAAVQRHRITAFHQRNNVRKNFARAAKNLLQWA
jgi:hypothetical protein